MKGLGRSLSLALVALLLVLVAGPVAAARCSMSSYCPMMAKAARSAPATGCPAAGRSGEMSAPMDCCRPLATPAPSFGLASLEPAPATLVAAPSGIASTELRAAPAAFSRAGQLHPLGLFTLHSVWRI